MVARTCSLPISSVKNHNIGGIPIEMVNIEVYFVPFCWIRVGTHKSREDTKELLWNEGRWKRHKKLSVTKNQLKNPQNPKNFNLSQNWFLKHFLSAGYYMPHVHKVVSTNSMRWYQSQNIKIHLAKSQLWVH